MPAKTLSTQLPAPDPVSIRFVDFPLSSVTDYFAKDFRFKQNEKVISYEAFVDHVKGTVIYKVFVETVTPRKVVGKPEPKQS
jgi:hypothetical protein